MKILEYRKHLLTPFYVDPKLVIFSFIAYLSSSFGQTFFIGLFTHEIENAFRINHSTYGTLYSLATLGSAILLLRTAQMIDKLSLKRWTIVILSALALGCVLLAAAQNWVMLLLAIFIMRQAGQGLMGELAFVTLGRYFKKGRGRAQAVSIAALGLPVAESILPIIAVTMMLMMSWRTSWLIYALFIVIFLLPFCLFLLKTHHARHKEYLDEIEDEEKEAISKTSLNPVKHYTRKQVFSDVRFYLLIPILILAPCFVTGIFFFQTHISDLRPWTIQQWAGSFPIYAVFNVIFTLSFGQIIERKGAISAMPLPLIIYSLVSLSLALPGHSLLPIVIFILLGMATGMTIVIHGILWAELFGTKHLGSIRSLSIFITVLASSISPILFGILFDLGVTLATIMYGFTLYGVLCTLLAYFLKRNYSG